MPTIKIQGEEVEIEFWREEIPSGGYISCAVDDCERHETYVNIDDFGDVICNRHRLEMSPGSRRRYIKIEDVPFKEEPRSASEIAFNAPEDLTDADPEDFELTDEEADAALVNKD